MNLIKRIGYYFFGLSIGIVLISFIFNGKKTSCNYGPQARVKSQLLSKIIIIPDSLIERNISSESIKIFIKNSSVDFSMSNTQKDSCKTYVLKGYLSSKQSSIEVENCSKALSIIRVDP